MRWIRLNDSYNSNVDKKQMKNWCARLPILQNGKRNEFNSRRYFECSENGMPVSYNVCWRVANVSEYLRERVCVGFVMHTYHLHGHFHHLEMALAAYVPITLETVFIPKMIATARKMFRIAFVFVYGICGMRNISHTDVSAQYCVANVIAR